MSTPLLYSNRLLTIGIITDIYREKTKQTLSAVQNFAIDFKKNTLVSKMPRVTMRRCIIKMNDPAIGDCFMCKNCKHFMLSRETAELHRKCTKQVLAAFEPEEDVYRCSTCGRYFDNIEQWSRHNDLHKAIGDYDPFKFTYLIDDVNNFVRSLRI